MNVEFHYYDIYFLCSRAGYSPADAAVVAYSSQFVDCNLVSYKISTNRGEYNTLVTQNYGWWDESFPLNVYIPFHFFPGDIDYPGALRKDGKTNKMNCTPNSKNVKKLLIAALKTRNLYRVGIGLHTYADSWAHQNFSGLLEDWNILEDNSLIPSIGHAHAVTSPDKLGGEWKDPRLVLSSCYIINKRRYLKAASKIYKYLCTYNRKSFDNIDIVMDQFGELIGPPDKLQDERIIDLIIECDIYKFNRKQWLSEAVYLNEQPDQEEVFRGYDKLLWLKDQALHKTNILVKDPLTARENFYNSHLYKWQCAAQEHLKTAKQILNL